MKKRLLTTRSAYSKSTSSDTLIFVSREKSSAWPACFCGYFAILYDLYRTSIHTEYGEKLKAKLVALKLVYAIDIRLQRLFAALASKIQALLHATVRCGQRHRNVSYLCSRSHLPSYEKVRHIELGLVRGPRFAYNGKYFCDYNYIASCVLT